MKLLRRLQGALLVAVSAFCGVSFERPRIGFKRYDGRRRNRLVTSIFSSAVFDAEGRLKRAWSHTPNLRTTAGLNWQADVMGNPTQPAPARYIALTADATTPASADTTLAGELTANGFARAAGTYAHTAGASSYTISNTFTATGTATINKVGLFTAAAAGTLAFEAAEPNPPTLSSGDTLAQTVTITI